MLPYEEQAAAGLANYGADPKALLLAIESSCDETAAAVLQGGRRVLSMAVHTQIPIHRQYGGVVPELASRSHVERIGPVVEEALRRAEVSLSQIDALAVTCGPGLVGALLVGVSYAKGLALALGLPLVGVNHLAGHIAANYLTFPKLRPPFTCLVASGGHSHIVAVEDYERFRLLGCTRDDAAGEAFDKVARALGLPYPGGPELEKLALEGDPYAYPLRAGFNEGPGLDMSFSGLKTAAVNLLHNAQQRHTPLSKADLAASFQRAVCHTLTEKAVHAAQAQGSQALALAGGVSANMYLRAMLQEACQAAGLRFYCPDFRFCTDNAAMIGCAGHYALLEGRRSSLALNGMPALALDACPAL